MAIKKNLYSTRDSKFQFPSLKDFATCWVRKFYPDKCVVFFTGCKEAFKEIPSLVILKRDDLNTFLNGTNSDFCLVTFDEIQEAVDFSYTINGVDFILFDKGVAHVQGRKRRENNM